MLTNRGDDQTSELFTLKGVHNESGKSMLVKCESNLCMKQATMTKLMLLAYLVVWQLQSTKTTASFLRQNKRIKCPVVPLEPNTLDTPLQFMNQPCQYFRKKPVTLMFVHVETSDQLLLNWSKHYFQAGQYPPEPGPQVVPIREEEDVSPNQRQKRSLLRKAS